MLRSLGLVLALVVLVGTLIVGNSVEVRGDDGPPSPKKVAKAVKRAIAKQKRGLGDALADFKALAAEGDRKDLEPTLAVIQDTLGKTDDSALQWVLLGVIEELEIPDRYQYIRPMVRDIPKGLTGTGTLNSRAKAIRLAGEFAEKAAIDDPLDVLDRPEVKFCRTAAQTLAHFESLADTDEAKQELVTELADRMVRLAKSVDARKEDEAQRARYLVEDLTATLTRLTGRDAPESPGDWVPLAAEWREAVAGD